MAWHGGAVRGVAGAAPRPTVQRGPPWSGAGAGRGVSGAAVCVAADISGRCAAVRGCRKTVPEYTIQRKFCSVDFANPGADGAVCTAGCDPGHGVSGRSNRLARRCTAAGAGAAADRGICTAGRDRQRRFGLAAAFARLAGGLRGGAVGAGKRLWGGKDSAAYAANLQTHRTNQKLAAAGMAGHAPYCFCLPWCCAPC